MWDAKVDRAPVIALTGQVQTSVRGVHNFQEVDLRAAFEVVADWSQTVLHDSPHAELVSLACKQAILRQGVAHLVFPRRGADDPRGAAAAGGPDRRLTPLEIRPPAAALDEAVARIDAAKRPAIIVGAGARFAVDDVIALAERAQAPVITSSRPRARSPTTTRSRAACSGAPGRRSRAGS